MRRIDELHLDYPFAGSRMLRDLLRGEGVVIGRELVATLMRRMGIEAIYRKPNTSKAALGHKIYPYLLRGLAIERPNQVWAMDITYIPMARGFVYLAAVVDWFSRRVLSWRLSITMDVDFCLEAVEEALARYGRPKIFNTDQGSQFTSAAFTGLLLENAIVDEIDWDLVMRAVRRHTDCPWVLLYLERWLRAPVSMPNGNLVDRESGTPQGAVVSPVLANLFL